MSKRRPAGFTLIELLIVVVIIGILAAIAIPKFGESRKRANQAALKSDLRNLMTAQEQYFGDANSYGTQTAVQTTNTLWAPSQGVSVTSVTAASDQFSAVLTKATATCTLTYGATLTATTNGVPVCN